MRFTREQAQSALASLNPALIFINSYEMKPLPEDLDIYFGPPEEFFIAPESQQIYTEGKLIPILDDGNFSVVTFLDPSCGALIQMNVETPNETRAHFHSWNQYLTDLMIQIGESVDEDTRLQSISELVHFSRFNELLEFFSSNVNLSYEQYRTKRKRFIFDGV